MTTNARSWKAHVCMNAITVAIAGTVVTSTPAAAGMAPFAIADTQSPARGGGSGAGPGHGMAARFAIAARRACQDRGDPDYCALQDVDVRSLTDTISLYTATMRVGPTDFDTIIISRVVRTDVHRPLEAIFMVHGSSVRFFDQYVTKTGEPDDPGIAMWLAERNVDVWGIDHRWALVPAGTVGFEFMRPWSYQTDVDDVMLATRFARFARLMTGHGHGQLNLEGFSNGASVALAVANAEAALGDDDRDVKGLIPVETVYKFLPEHETQRLAACGLEASQAAAIAAGRLATNNANSIRIGALAQTDPQGTSPFNAAYTNGQFAMAQTCNPGLAGFPAWHRLACGRDAQGFPAANTYSSIAAGFQLLAKTVPFRNVSDARDYWAIPCGETAVPFDDHLAQISIPVLYIGVAGGFGAAGIDVLSFLASTDTTSLLVRQLPVGSEATDFGHVDSFLAADADILVWQPILDWIQEHCTTGHPSCDR